MMVGNGVRGKGQPRIARRPATTFAGPSGPQIAPGGGRSRRGAPEGQALLAAGLARTAGWNGC
ncbi:MAG: hypothetical protein P8174_10310, partial [Gemmatimonadota bacterium]